MKFCPEADSYVILQKADYYSELQAMALVDRVLYDYRYERFITPAKMEPVVLKP